MNSVSADTAQARVQTSLSPAVMGKSACFDAQARKERQAPSEGPLRLINLFRLLQDVLLAFHILQINIKKTVKVSD